MKLAIETATSHGSVATLDQHGVVRCEELGAQRDHAKHLASKVAMLVDGRFDLVDGYALSIGPGSFTGLRVGLSFVKGLAIVHPRPAVGIGTLRVMAEAIFRVHPEATWALPVLDARRSEVFAGLFAKDSAATPLDVAVYTAGSLADRVREVEGIWMGGDATELDLGPEPNWTVADPIAHAPTAADLIRLAASKFDLGRTVDPQSLEPLYMQLSAAEQNLASGALSVKEPTRGV